MVVRIPVVVKVPLLYGLSEFNGLWACSDEDLAEYKAAFPENPKVTCETTRMAPNCI